MNRNRKIKECPAAVDLLGSFDIGNGLKQWLQDQAARHGFKWLLAHAYDGVIWGRVDNGKMTTSHEVDPTGGHISPPLRKETLLQARLFALRGELLIWRDGNQGWQARIIRDADKGEKAEWSEAIDECQILWGTDTQPLDSGFTLMTDGSQGLRHIVPLKITGNYSEKNRPLRLYVRHYIEEDKVDKSMDEDDKKELVGKVNGFVRIVASRLLEIARE